MDTSNRQPNAAADDTRPFQVQVKGSPDRDARGVPYEHGNRLERRKINKQINAAARSIRKLAQARKEQV